MITVDRALLDARVGVADLREGREVAEVHVEQARRALADAYLQLAATTHEVQRAAWPRHLQAGEQVGPRRALRCGEGPAASTAGATASSLAIYLPQGSRRT